MTDIKFTCIHCEQHLEAPNDMAGDRVSCPACSKMLLVPGPYSVFTPIVYAGIYFAIAVCVAIPGFLCMQMHWVAILFFASFAAGGIVYIAIVAGVRFFSVEG